MGTPWRRSRPSTTWTSSPRSAAPLTLCVCCPCDHATLLPNVHPGLQNCPIISNPPPIALTWGHESNAYMMRESLHLSPACSVWQEREAADAHLLDPEHLIVNGLGGAFLHPTHCFAHGDAVHTCAVAAEQRECAADRSAHPWLFHVCTDPYVASLQLTLRRCGTRRRTQRSCTRATARMPRHAATARPHFAPTMSMPSMLHTHLSTWADILFLE